MGNTWQTVAGMNVLHISNVQLTIAYPGLWFVMENMIALVALTNISSVSAGLVHSY